MIHEASLSIDDQDSRLGGVALAISEARLRALLEAAVDGIISIDERGAVQSMNPAAVRLFGYAADDVIGQNVNVLMPSPYREEHDGYLSHYLVTGKKKIIGIGREVRGRRKDGTTFAMELSVAEARVGQERLFVGIVRDISERKRAEERFRLAVESAPNAMVMIDDAGRIALVNRQTEKLFGYNRDELLGQQVELLVPERFRQNHPNYRAEFLAEPAARLMGVGRDLYGLRKDGGEFPVEIGLNPIRTDEGLFVLSAIVDITERKQADDTRASLAAIVEFSEDAIIGKNLDGTISSWNVGAERLYGYTAQEAVGRPLSILMHPDRTDEMPNLIERLERGERISHYETVRLRKDGSQVDVSLTISPVKNGDGQIVGASKIARDITEQKRAQQDLHESKTKLEKAVAELQAKGDEVRATTQQLWQAAKLASVGELAASIAHELNNPLATVTLRIESVLAHTPADDPRRRALEIIDQETKRMGELVANLLQFSRRGEEKISTVDIREELTKAVELMQHHLRKRQIAIVQKLSSDTPIIHADRQKLRQVFLNLMTNAGDAMSEGGTLTLRSASTTLQNGKPGIQIDFIDTGMGILPEQAERAFDPFYTTKEEGKGTGLGLAICRRAVEEHHGTIQLLSEVGKGTTVRIVLPLSNSTNVKDVRGTRSTA